MKTIFYSSLSDLQEKAKEYNKSVYETGISYSFRIYTPDGRKTIEFHVMYK